MWTVGYSPNVIMYLVFDRHYGVVRTMGRVLRVEYRVEDRVQVSDLISFTVISRSPGAIMDRTFIIIKYALL